MCSSSSSNNFDDMLFSMLAECKSPMTFLDEIFGFLYRRTDFFHIAECPDSPIGLPKGVAEVIAQRAFKKWSLKDPADILLSSEDVPAISEEIVISENEPQYTDVCDSEVTDSLDIQNLEINNRHTQNFSNSESYNGAVYDVYSWSQNISEVDVFVVLPGQLKAKDLFVNIMPDKLSVKHRGETLLEGDLCQKCKHNDAIWSIDNDKLQIHLDKCREMWWDCLLQSEPKLDLTKIDCSRPYEDLSQDAQAKIQELQWNQDRKRQGLSTSDQIKNEELLRKAWNAEGSPFDGPFDPSSVTFN